ncbi:ScyD/ScyE family protein [Aliifodinibius sp. S!AR15-10]|uniref:ScyD/ScyE family protein n=1 Tax=Aliifodinibius sp. S!AR15-10 TaxID=2950437 RepID=UPI00286406D1|nr:ScyD/ScyE family protein [Aliifodinibius sp. S!AR15-10]MDR8393940.1 ScyD/ScyE family protein [Aliifodinibius sp. S!AR15-10]
MKYIIHYDDCVSGNGWVMVPVILTCLALVLTSCTETSTDVKQEDQIAVANSYTPLTTFQGNAVKNKNDTFLDGDGFTSPLFGLATAPNGDILVADAGAGIRTLSGSGIALPGVTDVGPVGRNAIWASTGGAPEPTMDSGQALYRTHQGKTQMVANLFAFEEANDPDGAGVDSNPFDVQSLGGQSALVADAGGNDLLRINNQGHVEVVALFPDELVSTANVKELVGCPNPNQAQICGLPDQIPAQAVPTSIAVGPDGYYYVGELKGFPAPTGASNIWKISPDATGAVCSSSPDCVKVFEGGFTSIIDLAFDDEGNLLVAELDEQSWFAVEVLMGGAGGTINECDVEAVSCSEVATGIPILTAITVGKDGSLWATQNALIPGSADVIQVQ